MSEEEDVFVGWVQLAFSGQGKYLCVELLVEEFEQDLVDYHWLGFLAELRLNVVVMAVQLLFVLCQVLDIYLVQLLHF